MRGHLKFSDLGHFGRIYHPYIHHTDISVSKIVPNIMKHQQEETWVVIESLSSLIANRTLYEGELETY